MPRGRLLYRTRQAVFENLGDRVAVATLPAGPIVFLVGPARDVWELCAQEVAEVELAQRIIADYPDAPESGPAAVESVIVAMVDVGLLVTRTADCDPI